MRTRVPLILTISLILLLAAFGMTQAQGPNPDDGPGTASLFTYRMLGWMLGGNARTNPAIDFVGTRDAQPLVFRTNSMEAMRIGVGGEVGIGAQPMADAKLYVQDLFDAIRGISTNASEYGGIGVYGETASPGEGAGVKGVSTGISPGVWGYNETHDGVYGQSETGPGVVGYSRTKYGVYGSTTTPQGVGVFGENKAESYGATAIRGEALFGVGVSGHGGDTGVSGSGEVGVSGFSQAGSGTVGNSPSGVGIRGLSSTGFGGWFTAGDEGKAIMANGDVEINGDLTVTGQVSGFPRPNFDSGWVPVAPGGTETIVHNLGGNPEDYVVDMTFRDNVWGSGIHQITYGGDWRPDGSKKGVYWEQLNTASIVVIRLDDDVRCQEVRIRIWVYQ